MRYFGFFIHNHLPRCPQPEGASCEYCDAEIGPLDSGYELPGDHPAVSFWHRECLVHAILGPPVPAGDDTRAAARTFTAALVVDPAYATHRDRLRLELAKVVLSDTRATKNDVIEAIGSLQSTDDEDPEFLKVHDALQQRYKEMTNETRSPQAQEPPPEAGSGQGTGGTR